MATTYITPTSQVTPDNDVLTLELFIAAPRERIFQALTDPAEAAKWWAAKIITISRTSIWTCAPAANGP
jgi:uncharacterized protein YndB with AHSA1/START domain